MIKEYLDSLKKEEIESEPEIEPEKDDKPSRVRDILFPNIMMLNKKQIIMYLVAILSIFILLLIFIKTQTATPEFDKYHEDNKHLIERTDFYDSGEDLKKEKEEE